MITIAVMSLLYSVSFDPINSLINFNIPIIEESSSKTFIDIALLAPVIGITPYLFGIILNVVSQQHSSE